MASTTFSYGTIIASTWLNDVNAAVYNTIPLLAPKISPTFTTPVLGVATATSINKNTFSVPATNCTWTLSDGKTFTVTNTLTLAGNDTATLNIGGGGTLGTGAFTNVTGTNTGDQLTFKTVAVSGQSDIVADTITDTLTFAAGAGITLTTNATTDTLTIAAPAAGAMTLLATVTPTVAANVDFLTTFTSGYDNYLIIAEGLTNTASGTTAVLALRLANAGVVDSTSGNYTLSATPFDTVSVSSVYGGVTGAANVVFDVLNTNSTTKAKSVLFKGIVQGAASPNYSAVSPQGIAYVATNAVSGFRLYWTSGVNFGATGKVFVYGYSNT